MIGGGRAGRKGDGNGDECGQEGEAEHDAVVGVCVGGVSDEVRNRLNGDGGGNGDLYCQPTTAMFVRSPCCFLSSLARAPTGRVNVAARPSRTRSMLLPTTLGSLHPREDNMITLARALLPRNRSRISNFHYHCLVYNFIPHNATPSVVLINIVRIWWFMR